jgi:hypothetical protein
MHPANGIRYSITYGAALAKVTGIHDRYGVATAEASYQCTMKYTYLLTMISMVAITLVL